MGSAFNRQFASLTEEPRWCGDGPALLYTMAHRAGGGGPVVVVAGPDGEERDWSARSLVTASRVLAEGGCTVVRFDYRGQGESGGVYEETSVASRTDDLLAVCGWARTAYGQDPAVLGVRLGASVALMAAARQPWISRLVLWEPIANHGAYVNALLRQNLSAQMVVHGSVQKDRAALLDEARAGTPINVNGYVMTGTFVDELLALDSANLQLDRPMLIISGKELQGPMARQSRAVYTRIPCVPFWKEPKLYSAGPFSLLEPTLTWLLQTTTTTLREVS